MQVILSDYVIYKRQFKLSVKLFFFPLIFFSTCVCLLFQETLESVVIISLDCRIYLTGNSLINDALTKCNHLRQSLYEDNHAEGVILNDGSIFLLLISVIVNINVFTTISGFFYKRLWYNFENKLRNIVCSGDLNRFHQWKR